MAKLIFLLDENVINEYALDKERMTIGRKASNDIHIDNLAISGEHALLVTMGEDTYLEDLDSTNGTLVNKKQIRKLRLKHGDEVGLGKYKLKYLKDAVVNAPQPNGFSDTILVEPESVAIPKSDASGDSETPLSQESKVPGSESTQVEAAEQTTSASESQESIAEVESDALTPAHAGDQGPRLQILNGEEAGTALLLDKSMVKVGKPGEQVAVVTKRQEGYFITHVAGDSHPLINSKQIGAQAYALKDHDEIEVLGIKMEFCLE